MPDMMVLYGAAAAAGVGIAAVGAGGVALWRGRRTRALAAATALAEADGGMRVLVAADGTVAHATAAARALLGGATPLDMLAARLPDDDQAHEAWDRLRAAAEAGVAERVELPLRGASGDAVSPEWWLVTLRPAPPHGMAWVLEDVTPRRVIEDILMREREDQAEFLYFTPVGLFSADADGCLRFVNQRFAEWLGWEPEDLMGRPLADMVAEGTLPEAEGAWRGELRLRTRTGATFPALVIQNTYDDAGATRTRSVVVRDGLAPQDVDTDGTGAEGGADALAGGRFRWLFEGAPVGLCLLDLEGCVTDCNPAFERLAGRPRGDLVERPLRDLLLPEDAADLEALMHRVALGLGDGGVHREVRFAPVPGFAPTEAAAALTIAPMGSGAGVDALVAHFIDTTAQRTLEAQFAQAQKMQAMGQLAGGVAHDFNNLLTAMIGFSDLLLQRHGAGDPSFSDLMQIKQNANRAANLVRQLLAFSRKQPLKPRRLDITDALTEMNHLLRRLLGERVRLTVKHGRDVGPVRVDPGQFDQVIINLAVNARDAMAEGGELTIRTRAEHVAVPFSRGVETVPAGDYTVISVGDTGTGIAREDLGRIFEPFFSTKTGAVGAGTGLGLSTVYGIIRQTGGFLFVDSVVGTGTEFTIYLPRQEMLGPDVVDGEAADGKVRENDAAAGAVTPVPDAQAAAQPTPAGADLTGGGVVMLVEDEDPVRIFAARALRNKGYTVVEARTAEGALEMLAEGQVPVIDVLVTDMMMPGMNGADLARAVRRQRAGVPVILISGYSEEAARGEITDSDDIHFLPKPFSLQQLAAKVKAVVNVCS